MTSSNEYDLQLDAESKSKAKIIGLPISSFLEGKIFKSKIFVKNLSTIKFPGGKMKVKIHWATDQFTFNEFEIPSILPNQTITKEIQGNVLSQGYGLFYHFIRSSDGKTVNVYDAKGGDLSPSGQFTPSFHSISGTTSEELYEFWGMIIAAISLAIIAAEKIVDFICWVLSNFN
jgi:hypothetical protein